MTTEAPEAPAPEVVQPAEAVPDIATKTVELRTPRGFLAFRPDQTDFTPEQRDLLVAIGIDARKDPGVVPHARAFLHLCISQDLDPFRKEAYLIGRGQGDKRKYTMQTGIDGYRKIAARTGRFIRVLDVLWTGQEDSDASYRMDDNGVMRRVWYDQWPARRGYPGAAKVIIQHYDEAGNVVTTDGVADWGMYAPFSPKVEWINNKKTYVRDADGKEVMTLNDMWEKGYAHMLAKCAEALAYRKAFPASMGGFYTHEEMHRADQIERDRLAQVQAAQRRAAFEKASGKAVEAPKPEPEAPADPSVPEGAAPAGPLPMEPAEEPVEADVPEAESAQSTAPADAPVETLSEDEKVRLARLELSYLAMVLDRKDAETVSARQVKTHKRKSLDDFTGDEMMTKIIRIIRPHGIAALYKADEKDVADAYKAVPEDVFVDPATFIDEGEVMPDEDVDATKPHRFVNAGGICAHCEREEDDVIHPEG